MEAAVPVEVVEVVQEGEEDSIVEEGVEDEDLVEVGVLAEVEGPREAAVVGLGEAEVDIRRNSVQL